MPLEPDGLAELVVAGLTLAAAVLGFFLERRSRRLDRMDGERIAVLELQIEHLTAEVSELSDALEQLAEMLDEKPRQRRQAPKPKAKKPRR